MAQSEPIDRELVESVFRRLGLRDPGSIQPSFFALSFERLKDEVSASGLVLPAQTLLEAIAALHAGKHLMIRGAPGTGKTTMALAIGRTAASVGLTNEPMMATATADWSSVETVGSYRMRLDGSLRFHPGHVLDGMRSDRWVVIDELNRADIDKAIGQLFTVLSGHPVSLPFVVDPGRDGWAADDGDGPDDEEDLPSVPQHVAIVPPGQTTPEDSVAIHVSRTWRLIATLNDRDRDLLFDMSEALRRRFAVLDMDMPSDDEWSEILSRHGKTGRPVLDRALIQLVTGPALAEHPLGPAVLLDAAVYGRSLIEVAELAEATLTEEQILQSMLDTYINPHLSTVALRELSAADVLHELSGTVDPPGADGV